MHYGETFGVTAPIETLLNNNKKKQKGCPPIKRFMDPLQIKSFLLELDLFVLEGACDLKLTLTDTNEPRDCMG